MKPSNPKPYPLNPPELECQMADEREDASSLAIAYPGLTPFGSKDKFFSIHEFLTGLGFEERVRVEGFGVKLWGLGFSCLPTPSTVDRASPSMLRP